MRRLMAEASNIGGDARDYFDAARIRGSRRASVLHLIDLKRAGHSPTRTEFNIDRHDRVVRPRLVAARDQH